MRTTIFVAFVLLTTIETATADDCLKPAGPELAPKQTGYLLSAGPQIMQTNSLAPGGVGPLAWWCEYKVGTAQITLVIATQPSDPMPCKRKVAFE